MNDLRITDPSYRRIAFGAMCAIDPGPTPDLGKYQPLVELMARMLGFAVDRQSQADDAARWAESADRRRRSIPSPAFSIAEVGTSSSCSKTNAAAIPAIRQASSSSSSSGSKKLWNVADEAMYVAKRNRKGERVPSVA